MEGKKEGTKEGREGGRERGRKKGRKEGRNLLFLMLSFTLKCSKINKYFS